MQIFQSAIDYEVPHKILSALHMSVEPVIIRNTDVRAMYSTIKNLQQLAAHQQNCMQEIVRIHINDDKKIPKRINVRRPNGDLWDMRDPCDLPFEKRLKTVALVLGAFFAGIFIGVGYVRNV
jgi:hypothetical protein